MSGSEIVLNPVPDVPEVPLDPDATPKHCICGVQVPEITTGVVVELIDIVLLIAISSVVYVLLQLQS